jgi:antitoxin CcdA
LPRKVSPAPPRLLEAAREAGVNLSVLSAPEPVELVAARRARWREESREAMAAYNQYVEEQGVFSDEIRAF